MPGFYAGRERALAVKREGGPTACMFGRMILLIVAAMAVAFASPAAAQSRRCGATDGGDWRGAAFANTVSIYSMEWSPFGSEEWGWEAYLPLIQEELNTRCAPGTERFAQALAGFQAAHNLPAGGGFDAATFQAFRGVWQERRPFVMARVRGECPDPPRIRDLGYLVEEEEHADRLTRLLRRDVLEAYRRMVAQARRDEPAIAANPELLQIFSGFRDPEADAARCAAQNNCDGVRRAVCSPHRTGTAVDLYVGQVAGLGVDNTSAPSRLFMTRGVAYRWLVRNAHRYGFVPYVFEPWHWEYVGAENAQAQ
ncbi:MAG TPA: D-alanyl-D-alanine carboxypeptidase family protein [Brevundimonas sp.]